MTQELNHRNHHNFHIILASVTMMLISGVVRSDYPPPSEDSHGYYSRRHGSSNRAVVGGGAGRGGGGDGYLSDWNNRDWTMLGNPNPGKCIDIPSNLTLCRGIGYDQMRLPNLLEHDTLKEVSQQASSWVRLLAVKCHPDTQVFLCSLFAPVCLERPIWPCRSLCEAVKAGCEDRMLKYGFPWPEMLKCDQYPAEDDLCIGLRDNHHKDGEVACSACLSDTFESTVDHFCRADFVMRIKVKQAIVTGPDMKIDAERKRKILKTGSTPINDIRDSSLYIVNGASCDCSALDSGIGSGKNSSNFIVMGNMISDRLVLSFVHRIDKRSREISRALKSVRNSDICSKTTVFDAKSGSKATAAEIKKPKGTKGKSGKSKGRHQTSHEIGGARKGTPTSGEVKPTTTATVRSKGAATTTSGKKLQHSARTNKQPKKLTETIFY